MFLCVLGTLYVYKNPILILFNKIRFGEDQSSRLRGKVMNWDHQGGNLQIQLQGVSFVSNYIIDINKVRVISYQEDQKGEIDQFVIFTKNLKDYVTAFCPGDTATIEIKRDLWGNYEVIKVTNWGPRSCR